MIRVTHFLVLGSLLLCLIFCSSVSASGYTYVYKVVANKSFTLEPNSGKTYIAIYADAYVHPQNPQTTVLSINLQNVEIVLSNEKAEIISTYKSSSNDGTGISNTFLAVYDPNGVLSHIVTTKDDSEISFSVKLYGASVLQIDQAQAKAHAPPVSSRAELFYAEAYPVTSAVYTTKDGEILIRKALDLSRTTEIARHTFRNESLTCLKNTCRPVGQTNFKWLATNDIILLTINGQNVIKSIDINEEAIYYPFQESSLRTKFDGRLIAKLTSITIKEKVPPFILTKNSIVVSRPIHNGVKENLCAQESSKNPNLSKLYCALICQPPFSILFEFIVENGILGNQN